jgi:hypothetical protein
MKTLIKSASLLAAAITLAACQQQEAGHRGAPKSPWRRRRQRLSYGVALGLGRNMANDGMSVDVDAFALGLRDALSGAEQRLTPEEIRAEMVAFQERITPSARPARRPWPRPTRKRQRHSSPRTVPRRCA